MERSLMLQVLTYLRYANQSSIYSKSIRYCSQKHYGFIFVLLLQWFASLDNISSEERVIALRLFSTPVDAIRFASGSTKC